MYGKIKRAAALLCAVMMIAGAFVSVSAAEIVYPSEINEYVENGVPHIAKVYQLSLADSPSGISTESFERNGYVYTLLDITKAPSVGVDTQSCTKTITQDSSTGDLATVLTQLDGQMEVTTEDGYEGVLILDHKSVSVVAAGYATSTSNLSASRTYPNLSDADLSLVPKTVTENGKSLQLADVKWSTTYQTDGSAYYTANATYSGTSSRTYATGYTVTADYKGDVSKANCDVVVYTAIFTGEEIVPETLETESATVDEPIQETAETLETKQEETAIEEETAKQEEESAEQESSGISAFSVIGCVGGIISMLTAGVVFSDYTKFRRKKESEEKD